MNIHNSLRIEYKAAACRSEVMKLLVSFMYDAGAEGEAFLPWILSLNGVTNSAAPVKALTKPAAEPVSAPADDVEHVTAVPGDTVEIDLGEKKTGPLDEDERIEVLRFHAEGMSSSEIADKLGRSRKGFGLVVKRTVDAGTEKNAATLPASAPPNAEAIKADVEAEVDTPQATSQGPFAFMPADTPLVERRLHGALNDIGYSAPWTPELDWRMAEAIARGDGVGNAAKAVGISSEAVIKRWRKMAPRESTLDQRERLLKALRARADVWIKENAK